MQFENNKVKKKKRPGNKSSLLNQINILANALFICTLRRSRQIRATIWVEGWGSYLWGALSLLWTFISALPSCGRMIQLRYEFIYQCFIKQDTEDYAGALQMSWERGALFHVVVTVAAPAASRSVKVASRGLNHNSLKDKTYSESLRLIADLGTPCPKKLCGRGGALEKTLSIRASSRKW